MTEGQLGARLELLFSQQRFEEAEKLLLAFLEQYPANTQAQYMLAVVYYNQNKIDESRPIIEKLLGEDPDQAHFLALSTRLDMVQELYDRAEQKCGFLIAQDPGNEHHYNLMANIKFNQRNYDKALYFAEKALQINPEDLTALNLRTTASGILGKNDEANISINEALQQDPNNDWSIANHGRQLLNEGKVDEALERFKDALSINPNNDLAQFGLKEALKSKFWPYKMFYKYQMLMSRLEARQMWVVIIGAYFGLQILQRVARSNPELGVFLYPIVYLIVAVFLSTWLLGPLMNLYLLTNKYGKLLLDEHDKKSAVFVGYAVIAALVSLAIYLIVGTQGMGLAALFCVGAMIPLGSMFSPVNEDGRKKTVYFTMGILAVGIFGVLVNLVSGDEKLLFVAFAGIFIYQWFLNSIMIKAGSRIMD